MDLNYWITVTVFIYLAFSFVDIAGQRLHRDIL
jgi:hypothetical protein